MIAVTTQSQAWVLAAAIAAVATPLYLIWLIHFVRTQARIPSDRTRQSSAVDLPSVGGNSSRRGEPYEQSGPACPVVAALSALGAELEQVQFQWRRGA